MKKVLLIALFVVLFQEVNAQTYEYQIVTSIESVVPMGLGRSRIISNQEDKDYKTYTTSRTEETRTPAFRAIASPGSRYTSTPYFCRNSLIRRQSKPTS